MLFIIFNFMVILLLGNLFFYNTFLYLLNKHLYVLSMFLINILTLVLQVVPKGSLSWSNFEEGDSKINDTVWGVCGDRKVLKHCTRWNWELFSKVKI